MKGQKRLNEIRKRLETGIRNVNSQDPERYEIIYKPLIDEAFPLQKEEAGIALTEEEMKTKERNAVWRKYLWEESPQYQFLIFDRENPDETYRIMTTHWADIKEPTPDYMEKYMGGSESEPNIKKAIEALENAQERKKNQGGLEQTAKAVTTILGIFGGIIFLSTNITGNAVAISANSNSNFLGASLLIVGLITGFFWLKSRKK